MESVMVLVKIKLPNGNTETYVRHRVPYNRVHKVIDLLWSEEQDELINCDYRCP